MVFLFIGALSLKGLTNLSLAHSAFYGALIAIAISTLVFITLLLDSIPYFLRSHTVSLFTLRFRDAKLVQFGVSEQQAERVAEILDGYGIKRLTM